MFDVMEIFWVSQLFNSSSERGLPVDEIFEKCVLACKEMTDIGADMKSMLTAKLADGCNRTAKRWNDSNLGEYTMPRSPTIPERNILNSTLTFKQNNYMYGHSMDFLTKSRILCKGEDPILVGNGQRIVTDQVFGCDSGYGRRSR